MSFHRTLNSQRSLILTLVILLAGGFLARSLLKSCLRQSIIICRWAGEGFIILLKDTNRSRADRALYRAKLAGMQKSDMYRNGAFVC